MEYFINLVLLFFIYAFAGWCMEVFLKYRQYHRFINRGFLTGPVCPIYGCGTALITVVVGNIANIESGPIMTFAISFVICGLVEYLTSLILEKIFKARWWDYSTKPMNLHGRVWIGNLILFGIAGLAIIHILNPVIYKILGFFSFQVREWTAYILLIIISADFVVSIFVLKLVKTGIDSSEADNTEEISKEVRQLLTNRSYFHKRFADAYPEVTYKTERVQARIAAVKKETDRLRQEAEKHLETQAGKVASSLEAQAGKVASSLETQAGKVASGLETQAGKVASGLAAQAGKVASGLEPTHSIQASLVAKQDELISLIYDEESATEEMKNLKAEIERQKQRIDSRSFVKRPQGKTRK